MNIGKVSEITGLPAKTIRYYESIGLVVAERQRNGYRNYGSKHVDQLQLVRQARNLGFTVHDCRSLLSLYDGSQQSSQDVRALVKERLSEIESKIAELQSLSLLLSQLIEQCGPDDRPGNHLLDRLARPGD